MSSEASGLVSLAVTDAYKTLEGTRAAVQARGWPPERCLPVSEFLERQRKWRPGGLAPLVIDVRSPVEFGSGHLPGALNLPLLEDADRAAVGTMFKRVGREEAFDLALGRVFPSLSSILEQVRGHCMQPGAAHRQLLLYCFRGGMRSQSVASFLQHHGYEVLTLQGGYKAFVHWAMEQLQREQKVCILGGATGSGKTEVLGELSRLGSQVIDLEALACHKGSVFGHLGEAPQPASEQFRNELACKWQFLDPNQFVFLEDEGPKIGSVHLPAPIYRRMRAAQLVVQLDVPFDLRADRSLALYGSFGTEELSRVVSKFRGMTGHNRTQELLDSLAQGDLRTVCEAALKHYDKAYAHHLVKDRDLQNIVVVPVDSLDGSVAAQKVLAASAGVENLLFMHQLNLIPPSSACL